MYSCMATKFENETCSRCGGSGKYSYCQMYGDRCFKCAGAGYTLTKRGAAAATYLDKLRTIPLSSLKVGDTIKANSMTNNGQSFSFSAKVTAIEPATPVKHGTMVNGVWEYQDIPYTIISLHSSKYGDSGSSMPSDGSVKLVTTPEQVSKAIEYQSTLTKTGMPRKRKANQ